MNDEKNLLNTTAIDSFFVDDICSIVEEGRQKAYSAVNSTMMETYWKVGQRIVKEEQKGTERAEYGKRIIEQLSKELTFKYGQVSQLDI